MQSATPALRVLVADDTALGTDLVAALDRDTEWSCVARVQRLADVLPAVREHRPDLLLLGFLLNGATSLGLLAELAAQAPATQVLVLSDVGSDGLALASLRRGADGFIVHGGDLATLLPRLRACTGRALDVAPADVAVRSPGGVVAQLPEAVAVQTPEGSPPPSASRPVRRSSRTSTNAEKRSGNVIVDP